MTRKIRAFILAAAILPYVACESMLDEHPVDAFKSLYELSYFFYLTLPTTTVSGRVILCSLNNAGNPNVEVTLSGRFETRRVYTDSDGNFTFTGVRTAGYTLSASKQGHRFIPETQDVRVRPGGLDNVEFETSVTWERTIGGAGWEKAFSVRQANDCGYVVAGYTDSHDPGNRDFYIVKLTMHGAIEWEKTYGGASSEIAYSVDTTSDNGFIVCGYTNSYGSGLSDYFILKLDEDGEEEWRKYYGGTESEAAYAIRSLSGGGYAVAGYTETFGAGLSDFWVLKLDASGDRLWCGAQGLFGGEYPDSANGVIEVSDGGFLAVGSRADSGGNHDIWIVRIDEDGNMADDLVYDMGGHDAAEDVHETRDGGFIVAGHTDAGSGDCLVVKLDSDLNIEWEGVYGDLYADRAYSVHQTDDDGYIIAGYSFSYETTDNDMFILKLNSSGDEEWRRTFDGDYRHEDIAYSVRQTSEGGLIVAGFTTTYYDKANIWLFKLNSNGEIDQ